MSLRPYVGSWRHAAAEIAPVPWRRQFHSGCLRVTTNLTYAAEAASSKTLEALAEVIRALAPEVSGVSFHDFAADTLWMSEDFLLPEDYQLVEDSLSSDSAGNLDSSYAQREDGNYTLAIPVRDSQGAVNGAVRFTDYSTSGYVTTWKVGLMNGQPGAFFDGSGSSSTTSPNQQNDLVKVN